MNKKQSIFSLLIFLLFLDGCAITAQRELVSVKDIYQHSAKEEKFHVDEYLKENQDLEPKVKDALTKFLLVRGMTKEQVMLLAGKPNRILATENQSEEMWLYNLGWSGLWGSWKKYRLTFNSDILTNIEEWWLESI